MKGSRSTTNMQSKQGHSKKPPPEIGDDMDSRKSKEAGYKGDKSKKLIGRNRVDVWCHRRT